MIGYRSGFETFQTPDSNSHSYQLIFLKRLISKTGNHLIHIKISTKKNVFFDNVIVSKDMGTTQDNDDLR